MPHKKNPDVLELIRGKSARVIGALQTLMVLIKGLPLAYNRDLQEDKLPLFDAADTVLASLELAEAMIAGAELNEKSIESRLDQGFLDATTLMEQLIGHGVPMRSAHEAVGSLVRKSIDGTGRLCDLPDADFDQLVPGQGRAIKQTLGVRNALEAFQGIGSTGPNDVAFQLKRWCDQLGISAESS